MSSVQLKSYLKWPKDLKRQPQKNIMINIHIKIFNTSRYYKNVTKIKIMRCEWINVKKTDNTKCCKKSRVTGTHSLLVGM